MIRRLVLGAVLALALAPSLAPSLARAVEPSERLADPKLEARAEAIGLELRCLVCQNESIEQSNAGLAHDLRLLIRRLLMKGDTDKQVIDHIVARYGIFVLLDPPFMPATYLLWLGPPLLVLAGGAALLLRARRFRLEAAPALSPEESARAASLLAAER